MSEKSTTPSEKSQEEQETAPMPIDEVDNLKKALKVEQEKANDYLNRLKYCQADFENFQRRMRKEVDEAINYGNQSLICELLTIVDELEYAIEAGKRSDDKEAITEGVEMILKKMSETLRRQGCSKIDAVGHLFDPSKHDAIVKIPTKDYKEGTVIEEVRKGFALKEKIIRPSLVKVAIHPSNNNSTRKSDQK